MRGGLFGRVFPSYVVVVGLGLALMGASAAITARSLLLEQAHGNIIDLVRNVAATAEGLPVCSPEVVADSLEATAHRTGSSAVSYTVLSANGTLVCSVGSAPVELSEDDLRTLEVEGIASGTRRASGGAHPSVYAATVVRATDATCAIIIASRAAPTTLQVADRVTFSVVGTGLLVTLAIAFLMRAVIHRLTVRIGRIQEAARRYAQGELGVKLRIEGPPEILALAEDLNTMAEQLRLRIQAISRQRNELETILSSMIEGVMVLDESRRIVSMNRAAGDLLHVEVNASTGKTILQHVRNAEIDEIAETALTAEEPVERSVTIWRDQPSHLRLHATALPSGDQRPNRGILLVISDITRIKQLEEMRKDFVANVSHELKTPITSIKGFVETLIEGGIEDSEQSNRFLTIILNHANRLNLIIEDLLSLSRLEQSRTHLTFEQCELAEVLASTIEICQPAATAKSIEIRQAREGDRLALVNPNLLEQALVNLIDNAIKYSDPNSTVEINVTNHDRMLTIAVQDHGHGIPSADLPRVFERFYRTDKARSRELGGTGLGLAIVKHIAIAHNGDVAVRSTIGSGSTFTLTIPQFSSTSAASTSE